MPDTKPHADILQHNRAAWDQQAQRQCEWSRPVDAATIAAARAGQWQVHLTPTPLLPGWLDEVDGKSVLCLASAGGQQGPVLAAAGAQVTVFDLSERQLDQDRMVAAREGLELRTVQGDMRDLSVFADASFDYVFHPISNLYVPEVLSVWRECYRVLKHGGKLLASFYNPVVFVGDRDPAYAEQGVVRPCYGLPYAEADHLDQAALAAKRERGEALVFGHSLADQIGGQLAAGFLLQGYHEEKHPQPRFLLDRYVPTFIATCAVKP